LKQPRRSSIALRYYPPQLFRDLEVSVFISPRGLVRLSLQIGRAGSVARNAEKSGAALREQTFILSFRFAKYCAERKQFIQSRGLANANRVSGIGADSAWKFQSRRSQSA